MTDPLISVFLPTFNRPHLLARAIACFSAQTYLNRELVILDDAGQYENQKGAQWEIVSVRRRFRSLGEKNNAAIALSNPNAVYLAKQDDDDSTCPTWLESIVDAFESNPKAGILQSREAIDYFNDEWVVCKTHSPGQDSRKVNFSYHGGFAYRRDWLVKMRGYAAEMAGDDVELDRRRRDEGIASIGTNPKYPPFLRYWTRYYLKHPEALHGAPLSISLRGRSEQAYLDTAKNEIKYVGKLPPYTGEKVWEWAVPTTKIERPW